MLDTIFNRYPRSKHPITYFEELPIDSILELFEEKTLDNIGNIIYGTLYTFKINKLKLGEMHVSNPFSIKHPDFLKFSNPYMNIETAWFDINVKGSYNTWDESYGYNWATLNPSYRTHLFHPSQAEEKEKLIRKEITDINRILKENSLIIRKRTRNGIKTSNRFLGEKEYKMIVPKGLLSDAVMYASKSEVVNTSQSMLY